MKASGIECGPLVRAVDRHGNLSAAGLSKDSVAKILKHAASRAALETGAIETGPQPAPATITQAAENGVAKYIIRQSGHRSVATLRRYIRSGELFRHNAAAKLSL